MHKVKSKAQDLESKTEELSSIRNNNESEIERLTALLKTKDSGTTSVTAQLMDISEGKKSEEALRQGEFQSSEHRSNRPARRKSESIKKGY